MDTKTCIETCNAVYIEFNLQSLDWQMLTVTDCPVIFLNIHDLMKKDTNSPPNKPLRKICLLLIKYLFHEDPAFKSSIICYEKEIIWKGPTLHEKRSDITWLRSVFRWLCHWHVICLDNRPIQKKKYYWLTKSRNMMLRGCFPRSKIKVLIGSYRNVTEHELQRVMSDLLVKLGEWKKIQC